MNEPLVSGLVIRNSLNAYLNRKADNPAPAMVRITPDDAPAGSLVELSGNFSYYDYEKSEFVDLPTIAVTVAEYIRMDDGELVLVASLKTQARYGGVESEPETIQGYFAASTITAVLKEGSGLKTRVKCLSQHRRQERKADRSFPVSFFTPGSRVRLGSLVKPENGDPVVTVKCLAYNGPDSVLIITDYVRDEGSFKGENFMVNVSHVEEIIEHKAGALVWEERRTYGEFGSERFRGVEKQIAGKNHFVGYTDSILNHAIHHWLPNHNGTCYDAEKLGKLLWASGLFRAVPVHKGWDFLTVVNKKKLKRAILQLQGKVSVSARKVQDELNEEYALGMESDMSRFYD